jgi:hypothetical protein
MLCRERGLPELVQGVGGGQFVVVAFFFCVCVFFANPLNAAWNKRELGASSQPRVESDGCRTIAQSRITQELVRRADKQC